MGFDWNVNNSCSICNVDLCFATVIEIWYHIVVYCIGSVLTNEHILKWIIVSVLILVMRFETTLANRRTKIFSYNGDSKSLKFWVIVTLWWRRSFNKILMYLFYLLAHWHVQILFSVMYLISLVLKHVECLGITVYVYEMNLW